MKRLVEEYGLIVTVIILLILMVAFWYGGFGDMVLGGSQDTTNKVVQSSNKTGAIIEDYEEGSYTISLKYDTNGGKDGPETDVIRVKYPSTTNTFIISSVAPKKSGYAFAGWFTSVKGGDQITGSYKVGEENYEGNQSTTLYAHWAADSYINTLKYDANGGSGAPSSQTMTVLYAKTQSTFTLSTTKPTRKGYTFDGWYTKAEGGDHVTGTYKVGEQSKDQNQSSTLYAHWAVNKYAVVLNYDANGGESAPQREAATVTYPNTTATFKIASETPTRKGYTFAGWYTKAEGGTQATGTYSIGSNNTDDDQNVTLYAHWTANKYINTLKYDANGGSGVPAAQTVNVSYPDTQSKITLSTTKPIKTGYNFAGWYTKAEGGDFVTGTYTLGSNNKDENQTATLYAHWTKDYVLNLNGVINGVTYSQLGKDGDSYIATADVYINGSKVADDVSSYSKQITSGAKYEIKDIKVNSKYSYTGAETVFGTVKDVTNVNLELNSICTVSYDANTGTGTMSSSKAVYASTFTATKNAFTKSGYSLESWNTKANGSGTVYSTTDNQKWAETTDITLYAQWTANTYTNTLRYDANGGEDAPVDQSEGGTYPNTQTTFEISNKEPIKTGYTFVGWYTSATGGSKITGKYTVGNKNTASNQVTVLYAHWEAGQYANTLKYDANGGTNAPATQTIMVTYPKTQSTFILTTDKPSRAGYSFVGWFTKASGGDQISGTYTIGINDTTKAQSATLYAHWTANEYMNTLTYNANGGSGAPDSQSATVTYPNTQTTFTVSSTKPTRMGYTFAGWYTEASGGTAVSGTYTVGNTNNDGNQTWTLYAHWTGNKYTNTLIYNANGGSGAPDTQIATVTYPNTQTTFSLSSTKPTKTGYIFAGWYTEASGGTVVSGTYKLGNASNADNQSATLYAQWTINKYTLTITGDSGVESITGAGSYDYGSIATVTYKIKSGYKISKIVGTSVDGSNLNYTWTSLAGKSGTVTDTWNIGTCNRTAKVYTEADEALLETGYDFNSHIPDTATSVVFTTASVPNGTTVTDLSATKNGSVVGWLNGTTWYVGSQLVGKKIIFNPNSSRMFEKKTQLTSINFGSNVIDTSKVTTMYRMFLQDIFFFSFDNTKCSSLTSLDLSSFDTSNVTDMSYMFSSCDSLTSLNLSNFNTSNVTDMSYMFNSCDSLTSLNLSNFNTSKVTDMRSMFSFCDSLTSLNVSNFNTSKVTDMSFMFSSCDSLTSLNLSNFNTSKVTDMSHMFSSCDSLTSLNVSNFNTSNVTDMNYMFSSCDSLTSLNLSNFNTSKVTDMSYMFYFSSELTSINLSGASLSNVTDMSKTFCLSWISFAKTTVTVKSQDDLNIIISKATNTSSTVTFKIK